MYSPLPILEIVLGEVFMAILKSSLLIPLSISIFQSGLYEKAN